MSDETTYQVEHAKSGRGGCKRCKETINKNELRLAVTSHGGDFPVTRYLHLPCFNLPRKYATGADKMTIEQFVDDILRDESGDILPAKREQVIAAMESKPAAKAKQDDIQAQLAAAYKAKEEQEEGGSDEPAAKKPKTEDDSKEKSSFVTPETVDAYGIYHKHKNDDLKDILRWNRQMTSGNKSYLMTKCIDGHCHGRLALCSMCGGRLKLEEKTGMAVTCNGIFDEDSGTRIACVYHAPASEAPRWKPWFTEEPSESEQEEMDRLEAEAKGEEVGGGKTEAAAMPALKEAASKLEWTLSSKQGIRAATDALLKILRDTEPHVDLPEDDAEAKRRLGPLIAGNRDKSAEDIIPLVVKEFGFAEDKQAKAEKKEAAISVGTKNPKNAPLVAAFQELAELYFKEGNRNAGATYSKAVRALQEIDFEITEENAMGLGKGKTKVPGIGKSTCEKIFEFCQKGTFDKLEEKRALASS